MSLALAPLAIPLPIIDGKLRMVANAPNLVVALVAATILAHPAVLLTRSYPPTLIQLWRGFQCQQTHQTCWQEWLHTQGRCHLPLL
jgi:hypothetical protein